MEICAAVANALSRAIPERLGFCSGGVLRGVEWLSDGQRVDRALYAMLAEEWCAAKSAC